MFVIRLLTVDDASEFVVLRRLALVTEPSAFPARPETDRNSNLEIVRGRLGTATAENGPFVIGAFDPSLVGILGVIRGSAASANLWGFYVDVAHRRAGIGRALVQRALQVARQMPNMQRVDLAVSLTSTAATLLYEQVGFRTVQIDIAMDRREMTLELVPGSV